MKEALLDIVFPPSCVACADVLPQRAFFCAACEASVEETPRLRCRRCAEPGHFALDTCPRCTQRPPEFATAFAPFEHVGAVAKAVHRFKYEDQPDLARPLGLLLAQRAAAVLPASAVVCPIPLHERRFKERKYDQATLLAVEVARRAKLEFNDALLTRQRETARQVGLTDAQREANVRGAFKARPCPALEVVLVDDVLTTGATAREATRALLEQGAASVVVLTLARARRESL